AQMTQSLSLNCSKVIKLLKVDKFGILVTGYLTKLRHAMNLNG
ncbi:unnamed protein product, partial [Oikopleura dioica]